MNRDRDAARSKLFTRRLALLAGGKMALFGVLIGRMYYLQVVEADKYRTMADDNRINLRLLAPPRGRIVDRYGRVVAENQLNYRVVVVAEQTGSVAATLDALSEIVPISETERRRILREVSRKRRFLPVTVKDNLAWDDVSRIAVNSPDLPGVSIDVGSTRLYPFGDTTSHLIGYVAPPAESDLTGDPLLELPDFRIGRNGIERVYDLALRGRAGNTQIEVNALGRPIRELARNEGEPGHDIVLTLDATLQEFTAKRLAQEESAAAVVMDVTNGDVLAMVSHPSYDPHEFARGISGPAWRALLANSKAPLTNKAISGQYAPGSTYKMMVALAAMESGVSPDFRVNCPGHMELGDNKFHCWKRGGHGPLDMVEALSQSCDVYFYEMGRRIGPERMAEMARRFGLGSTLSIDLPGERGGIIPTRAWKQARTGKGWATGESLVASIGQGYVLTTPLQLATMTARLVNGGFAVTPHLTRDIVQERRLAERPQGNFPPIGVPQANLAVMLRGMRAVINDPRGTAFRQRIVDQNWTFGGKTGTSQVRRITEEERRVGLRKPDQVPWRERDHALFVGYAPLESPRYAISVIVEHGGGGSSVAAPIAKEVLSEAMRLERERERTRPQGPARIAERSG
ncbi:MAG: penicillin-binding protein 2 [Alphaproteobacteria bacterium]|nr:penicillin-binding protein 2 [Alphaproteobacteria bacterium]